MTARKSSSLFALALLPLAVSACGDGLPALPSTPNAAVVYGRVTSSAGSALREAWVRVEAFEKRGTCSSQALASTQAQTDSVGAYRVVLSGPPISPRYDTCLRVLVDPPVDSAFAGAVVTGREIRMVSESLAPFDSVEVNVALQRRP